MLTTGEVRVKIGHLLGTSLMDDPCAKYVETVKQRQVHVYSRPIE